MTMRLSSTVMEIWPFEVLPGQPFPGTEVGRRSVLNITYISYTLCPKRTSPTFSTLT